MWIRLIGILAIILVLTSCAVSKPTRDYKIAENRTEFSSSIQELIDSALNNEQEETSLTQQDKASGEIRRSNIPSIASQSSNIQKSDSTGQPELTKKTVDAAVPSLALPEFIDVVFGQLLSVPYVTGKGVSSRKDVVQLRSSGEMGSDVFLNLVTMALKDYGVQVFTENGVYQIVEDNALKARLPRFIKSRARAGTPSNLRPVVQFVELQAIRASDMSGILKQAFDSRNGNLKIETDGTSNYLILSGLPDDVNSALAIINQMDELQYAGTQVQRYRPSFWNAATLSRELINILNAEGWQTGDQPTSPKPILLLSVNYSNDLLIFTRTPQARERTMYWVNELDQPNSRNDDGEQLYVYSVKHLDAQILADTANSVVSNYVPTNNTASAQGQSGLPGQSPTRGSDNGAQFFVDRLGNRLIYSGSPSDYNRILPLLESLDQPTPEVLIEVMIAQISLSDTLQSGVEWVVNNIGADDILNLQSGGAGFAAASSLFGAGGPVNPPGPATIGPLVGPNNGASAADIATTATVNFSAFAENSQVDVLSTPRLVARSGSSAQVQVGAEIPVLSAQRTPIGGAGGATNVDVISSVEYRSTGIILQIEPIVFSNNRIDLNVTQEVSATLPGGGPIASPSFSNTSVTTQLSLEDGATAVIGGLIQDNISRGESGIPYLKDIPIIGNAFSEKDIGVDRTELVILITAYVLRSSQDHETLAKRLSDSIDQTLNQDNLITLRPRNYF